MQSYSHKNVVNNVGCGGGRGGSIFHAYAEQVHITLWVKRGGMVAPLASPQQGMCSMHIQMLTVGRTVGAGGKSFTVKR